MEQKNLKLAVKNFGPIREGEVEFKPLTVFIGPNNSGKSYMATLLYALIQALTGRRGYPATSGWPVFDLKPEDMEELIELNSELSSRITEDDTLIDRVHAILRNGIDDGMRKIETGVPDVFREYFGCRDLNELVYRGSTDFSVDMFAEDRCEPILSVRKGFSGSQVVIEIKQDGATIADIGVPRILDQSIGYSNLHATFYISAWNLWRKRLTSMGICEGEVRYLPAGRSGLLQGWGLTASLAIRLLGTGVGSQDAESPSLLGAARDFTQLLISIMSERQGTISTDDFGHTIHLLEKKVLNGSIYLRTDSNVTAMGYESGDLRLPMQRASSMVSELAPIHLWIKHVLKRGDVLIIDEPEAHLHPENQRLIAQVLVRLMNAGVRVVCTTHSSLILHQLSNHILATSSGKLGKVGFSEHDRLNLEDIGVYLFELDEDGSRIKGVEVDSDFGISEDEFVRVAEQIGEETYQLVT